MVNTAWIKNLKTPIAVIGLGKSGKSAVALLQAVGFSDSDIFTYDDKDPTAQISDPENLILKNPKTVVVSPGVPLSLVWIQKLIKQGSFLTSEVSLAASVISTENLIGVTGSVGKSTVVSILAAGAKYVDPHCFIGGNLGVPFCDYALHILNGNPRATWIVLELSSYQLENCKGLSLKFSAVTFLSENHLERYATVDSYYKTKLVITTITENLCVFNQNSRDCLAYSEYSKCAYYLASGAKDLLPPEREKIQLVGIHNQDNFAIARKMAQLSEWPLAALEKMYQFSGLSHRLETIGTFKGVLFINDSKATALDSVLVAVKACLEKVVKPGNLHLLLGGKDKNLPWHQLSVLANDSRIKFNFFGACGGDAQAKSHLHGLVHPTLKVALSQCLHSAQVGDTVLLSPGGTSLDEFNNFEHRGEFFRNTVRTFFK